MKKYCLALLFVSVCANVLIAQTVVSLTTPVNKYLYSSSCCSEPRLNITELNKLIARTTFTNTSTYNATPNDNSNDLTAIANCMNAAVATSGHLHGVKFNQSGTYLLGGANSFNNNQKKTITVPAGDTLIIYAYNATLKANNLSRNTFLSFQCTVPTGSTYSGCVIWVGGTIDGNQTFQIWPGNPRGGQYNGPFPESHARMVGIIGADFAVFNDVNVINTVVDGPTAEVCNLTVFNNSTASNGAPIHWNDEGVTGSGVLEQGSYFKTTRIGLLYSYFLNLTCDGGSIGVHVSTETSLQSKLNANAVAFIYNCNFKNQAQDAIHIEDNRNVVIKNCHFDADLTQPVNQLHNYLERIWFTNQTANVAIDNCSFRNTYVTFNLASVLNTAIISNSSFVSDYTNSYLPYFINNGINVVNCTFAGKTGGPQVWADFVKYCTFSGYNNQYAITGSTYTDSCTFPTGVNAINSASGNFHNNYSSNAKVNNTPSGTWFTKFQNRIDIYNKQGSGTPAFLNSFVGWVYRYTWTQF